VGISFLTAFYRVFPQYRRADIGTLTTCGANAIGPGSAEMETLSTFRVPPNCRRLVHRWRDRQRVPDVREL
jgi:hypothetical protein